MTPLAWTIGGLVLDALAFLILAHDVVDLTKRLPGWEMADREFNERMRTHIDEMSGAGERVEEELGGLSDVLTASVDPNLPSVLYVDTRKRIEALGYCSASMARVIVVLTERQDAREHAVQLRQGLTLGRAWLAGVLFVIGASMQVVGLTMAS